MKEENRRIGDIQPGEALDYWCDSEFIWKNGVVTQVTKTGTVTIAPRKGNL